MSVYINTSLSISLLYIPLHIPKTFWDNWSYFEKIRYNASYLNASLISVCTLLHIYAHANLV